MSLSELKTKSETADRVFREVSTKYGPRPDLEYARNYWRNEYLRALLAQSRRGANSETQTQTHTEA